MEKEKRENEIEKDRQWEKERERQYGREIDIEKESDKEIGGKERKYEQYTNGG